MNKKVKVNIVVILIIFSLFFGGIFFQKTNAFTPVEVNIDAKNATYCMVNIGRVERLSNGSMLAMYNKYTSCPGHDDTRCSVWKKISVDGGTTWLGPTILKANSGDGSWGAHVGGIVTSPNGTLIVTYLKWKSRGDSDVYYQMSWDDGETWHDKGEMTTAKPYNGYASPGIVLSDGYTIIMGNSGDTGSGNLEAFAQVSTDNGTTWNEYSIPRGGLTHLFEPNFVELSNGTVYALCRTEVGHLYESWSEDKGVTWSIAQQSILQSADAPCILLKYSSSPSRILIMWDNTSVIAHHRYPLDVGISYDNCISWNYTKTVKNLSANDYHSYPDMEILPDNKILAIWWSCTSAGISGYHDVNSTFFPLSWFTDEVELQFVSIDGGGNETVVYNSTPVFVWTKQDNTIQYHLQIATDNAFTTLVVNISDINEVNYPTEYSDDNTNITFTLPTANALTVYDTYYCRVRAYTL